MRRGDPARRRGAAHRVGLDGDSLVATLVRSSPREMLLVLRDPFSLIFSLVQPLVFLGLFGPLLAGSVDPAALGGQSPLQWFLPGVIVMICLFGTGMAGSNLLFEITPRLLRAGAGQPAAAVVDPDRPGAEGAGAAGRPGRADRGGRDPVRVRALPAARDRRAAAARRLRRRDGRVLLRAGHRLPQAGVDVLGGAAVAAVPAADPVRDDAAAGDGPALDAGRSARSTRSPTSSTPSGRCSPARSPTRRSAGRPRRGAHLRRRPVGRHQAGPQRSTS